MDSLKHGKFMLDFGAKWCGPCRSFIPVWDELEKQHSEKIAFLKYDVDVDREMAMAFGIQAMPTFIAIHNGQEVGRVRGASREKVEELIQKLLEL